MSITDSDSPAAGADNTATKSRPLSELLRAGALFLRQHGVGEGEVICELLAGRLLRAGRLELYRFADQPLRPAHVEALRRGIMRVAAGEPVQYVLGEWDFHELNLLVDRRALIPRPETEQLVELVISSAPDWGVAEPLIVDVGTGSGCIALSVAHALPGARLVAIDVSSEALSLARENASRCGLVERVEFREESGCGHFKSGSVDVIISNPPYIASATIPLLARHIRDHEPRLALDGGTDGLRDIRAIVRDAALVLRTGGAIYLEIGDDQGWAVRDLLESHGFGKVVIKRDLAGKIRFAMALLEGL